MTQKDAERGRRYRARHPERARASVRKYHAANREKIKVIQRRYRGVPEATRPMPEHCECCGRAPGGPLYRDHDHTTGKFRGWLCVLCNTGIGKLGDNIDSLLRAIHYLKAYT